MTNGRTNTDLQLPSQSKHGVIMKTAAFHDPDTQQKSWLIATKTKMDYWQILECKTEMFENDDPYVQNTPYKNNILITYGEVIRIFAEHERIRKGSGMLDPVDDYPTTGDIPHYKEVAHKDGIIFDVEGFPHPTLNGNPVTEGKFRTVEIKNVLSAVKSPASEEKN